MTDLAKVSDDELLASLPRGVRNRNPGNIEDGDFARSLPGYKGSDGRFAVFDSLDSGTAAQAALLGSYGKRGLNTVEGIVSRWAPREENDTDAYVQFVSDRLGVKPGDPLDMEDGGTLNRLAAAMAEHENGVPLAGGSLSSASDDELLASIEADGYERGQVIATSEDGSVTAELLPPERPDIPTRPTIPTKGGERGPVSTVLADAGSGLAEPFVQLGRSLADRFEEYRDIPAAPRSPGEFVDRLVGDLGKSGGAILDTLNLASAPLRAVARPAARLTADAIPLKPGIGPELSFEGGVPRLTKGRDASEGEERTMLEGAFMDALSAARPAKDFAPPVKPVKAPTLEELKAANTKAWKDVDASGYRFPKKDVQATAKDIAKLVDDAGPELYPEAAKVARRVEELAKRGDLTPAQANRLRSQIGEKLLTPGSTEVSVGGAIKARLDSLIDAADDVGLRKARDLYTRLIKTQEVVNRLDSAELRAASTYAGGNKANATRQTLRPLIDPKSPQRMRNLTPAEAKALRDVVKGTPAQNAVRLTGKALDPRGLLGATVQTLMGLPTGGASTLSILPGVAASELSNTMTAAGARRLIDLMAAGGSAEALRGIPLLRRVPGTIGAVEALQLPPRALGAREPAPPLRKRTVPARQERR